jgi:glycosyltransferase involved in cell wall biosynthesis
MAYPLLGVLHKFWGVYIEPNVLYKMNSQSGIGSYKQIAYLSSYPPRECGIATFTKDLVDTIEELYGFNPSVLAINEKGVIYDYDGRVKIAIKRECKKNYVQAAQYINSSNIDLVNIQHEFGLFGGECGEYIKLFFETLKKPVVTTLHTVLPDFNPKALEVLKCITDASASTIVISYSAIEMLKNQGINCRNIQVIPHGCPNIEFVVTEHAKVALGLKNRLVASTFGLISNSKGIEYAIRALSHVVKKEPRILYLIIGQTHPEVIKQEGEKYRNSLKQLVSELGLEANVRFINRFLSKLELIEYLQATDIYLTPYISPNQISSGTLTYAAGAGKAIVSTPYFHAQEILADNRGVFCKFKDSISLAEGIIELSNAKVRKAMQKRMYKFSRRFVWANIAQEYVNLFNGVIEVGSVFGAAPYVSTSECITDQIEGKGKCFSPQSLFESF